MVGDSSVLAREEQELDKGMGMFVWGVHEYPRQGRPSRAATLDGSGRGRAC